MTTSNSILKIEALTPAIGSMVHNIDISDPRIIEDHGAELKQLLLDRGVIFFRDQNLTPDAQVRFAKIFGDVVPEKDSTMPIHPDNGAVRILEAKADRYAPTDRWHADLTFREKPPLFTCLYAIVSPPVGGDTMWASMTAAFDHLEPKMQEYVEGLRAIHNWEAQEVVATMVSGPRGQEGYMERRGSMLPLIKPVIIRHPETGKKILYVNSLFTKEICGVNAQENSALISLLTGLAQVPEWQVRFRWQPGSLAIWDNWSTQHYAVNDYHPAHRLMHRVTVEHKV